MTKQEVNKLLALAKANYSYAFKNMSRQEKYMLLESWAFSLQDIDSDIAVIAFMQLLSTSKWLPTVAEIREKVRSLHYEAAYADVGCFNDLSDGQKRAAGYIARKTEHLRGDNSPPGLTLKAILSNPGFAGIGPGSHGFAMLDGAKYEIEDTGEATTDEQGSPDRQFG